MASNLDYLDPALIPLEEKVKAYLEAEKNLRQANDAGKTERLTNQAQVQSAAQFEQYPPTGSNSRAGNEQPQQADLEKMRHDLAGLERDIIALLPTRDEWVKVNLGYGPSRVGAWHVPASNGTPERYELRVVH